MRSLLSLAICLLTCLLTLPVFARQPRPGLDVQHYRFALALSDASDTIRGEATITCLMRRNTDSIVLDLMNLQPDGKGMKVQQVLAAEKPLLFRHSRDRLNITLPAVAKAGDTCVITVFYKGIPADGLTISNNLYNHRGFFGDNWPNRARHWLPCVDHPADKASVEFLVTAPAHYQVVSNGVQVEATSLPQGLKLTHYKETVPLPTKVMVIGVSDFAVQYAGDVQCITVHSWVYPENKDKAFYDLAQATDILPFFIGKIGPFAYRKLANVQSKTIFGGMENAGAIFYAEGVFTGQRKTEALIVHEIAHQWFGNMATETDWSHLWLSEGFATFMTNDYFEQKYGPDTARFMRNNDRIKVIGFSKRRPGPVVDSAEKDYMQLLNANSYQKGGWVLHMLRRQLGDSTFWKGVRTYYARYAGKNASTQDLRRVLEEVSGQDLGSFFRQWLYTSGQPSLDIRWRYDAAAKVVKGTIAQQQSQLFRFPLELAVYGGGNTVQMATIAVKDKETSFTIPFSGVPGKIVADPGVNLLAEYRVSP